MIMITMGMKPCPFCGGLVEFEVAPYRIYNGKCIKCGMEFRYKEELKEVVELTYMQPNNIPWYRRPEHIIINTPFNELWNRRND